MGPLNPISVLVGWRGVGLSLTRQIPKYSRLATTADAAALHALPFPGDSELDLAGAGPGSDDARHELQRSQSIGNPLTSGSRGSWVR